MKDHEKNKSRKYIDNNENRQTIELFDFEKVVIPVGKEIMTRIKVKEQSYWTFENSYVFSVITRNTTTVRGQMFEEHPPCISYLMFGWDIFQNEKSNKGLVVFLWMDK